MESERNTIKKNFLKEYLKGNAKEVRYLPLNRGFLKLEYGLYDNPGILSLVSFVLIKDKSAFAVGPRLEMMLQTDICDDKVTFIRENGVSGRQWYHGHVFWGHTYDDSNPSEYKTINLDDWVDECICIMINPDKEEEKEWY